MLVPFPSREVAGIPMQVCYKAQFLGVPTQSPQNVLIVEEWNWTVVYRRPMKAR
jgi:hypothetical protein